MKTITILFAFLFPFFLSAQIDIKIDEQSQGMSRGTQPAFVVTIPQVDLKNVESDFKKYIKKGAKGKVTEEGGEILMLGATNNKLSPQVYDLYARVTQSSNGVVITSWFSEAGAFVSSQSAPSKAVVFKQYIRSFAVDAYKEAVKEEVKEEENKLKDEQKKLEGFQKDQSKAESNIKDHREEIASREKKIVEEQKNIEISKQNQQNQQQAVKAQEEAFRKMQAKYNGIQ